MNKNQAKGVLGWREWVALPSLGIDAIKAKVDTGARTSALHAFEVKLFRAQGREMARFGIHPVQKRTDVEIFAEAEVIDERWVTDSGGHKELRPVIRCPVEVAGASWPIEITLTNRDNMGFRMLLGRTAISGRFMVDPHASYLAGETTDPAAAAAVNRDTTGQ